MTEAVSQPISTPGSTLWARLATEVGVARVALSAVALHIVDDAFLQPEPGMSAFDHPGALVPLALVVGFAAAYPRLRAGVRAAFGARVRHLRDRVRDRGRVLHAERRPVGRRLHRLAVARRGHRARRSRRRHALEDAAHERQSQAPLPAAGAARARGPRRGDAGHVPARHRAGRDAHRARTRPDPRSRCRPRGRVVHDLGRAAARGLVRAVAKRRDRDRRPRPVGSAEADADARAKRLRRAALRPSRRGRKRRRSQHVRLGEASAICTPPLPISSPAPTSTRSASAPSACRSEERC